jgi:hypothetical protein
MPWSAGIYTRWNAANVPPYWVGDASVGIKIEATRHDTQDQDFQDGINACFNRDGSNVATGNLNLNSNKITNLGAGTARTDAAQVGQVQDGTSSYLGTTGGTATAFTVTATPTITALVTGAQYSFKANAANGVAATLKIDGTTATTMQRQGTALVGNEFKANDFVSVVYDGTNFQITNVATAPLYVDRTNNRVGIGTTAPIYDFEVASTATRSQITRFSADTVGTQFDLAKSRGASVGTNTIVQSGDILGVLRFAGANGTGFSEAASIAGLCDGTPGATNDMPGRIAFYTTADGAGTATERMRINNSGEVLIDATTSLAAPYRLQVGNGTGGKIVGLFGGGSAVNDGTAIFFFNGATNIGNLGNYSAVQGGAFDNRFTIKNSGTNFVVLGINAAVGTHFMKWNNATGNWTYDTSSARYKDNIEDSSYGLAEVLAMRPVTFTYKAEPERHDVGFIAEEMVNVIPEVVAKTTEGEPDAISYDRLTSVLCKAIQELNVKVEALEARIAALEA